MKVYPTLNIQHGRVVPAIGAQGLDASPVELLSRFLDQGFTRVALVDVDAAHGTGNNRELLSDLISRCRHHASATCVQVAGGIRSSDQAQLFVDHGANWLVVGTILHKSPLLVEQLLARFQKHLTAAIDARAGQVHRSGWSELSGQKAEDLAARVADFGFKRLLFVDLPSEAPPHPDFATAQAIHERTRLPLLMGGSMSSRAHVEGAMNVPGLQGVLVDALLLLNDPHLAERAASPCA